MKAYFHSASRYPDWNIRTLDEAECADILQEKYRQPPLRRPPQIEIPQALYDRWRAALAEYNSVQDAITVLEKANR